MRNNQKYSQEEMYLAIELWKESGLSQQRYCHQNSIALNTFRYWVKKYLKEKKTVKSTRVDSFLPIQVKHVPEDTYAQHTKELTITYPNGIEVKCPVDISSVQLKTLLTV